VSCAQVDLVARAIQAEPDRALSFAAIKIVDEKRLYLLRHPYLRPGCFTPFDSTSYAINAIRNALQPPMTPAYPLSWITSCQ
jgi:hypothetical protein